MGLGLVTHVPIQALPLHYQCCMTTQIPNIQDLKNVKRYRDGMPKVCKQGRNDIIIVKVNLQSLIPASFSHYLM